MAGSERSSSRRQGSYGAVDGRCKDIDLDIDDGEFVVFVGPSGCGKSTLLRLIAGLEKADRRRDRASTASDRQRRRRPPTAGLAMVFQSYALYPHMSVRQNLAFGLENTSMPRAEIDARVDAKPPRMLEIEPLLAAPAAASFPAASASASPSAAPSCASPTPSCSTSRCRTSTPNCASRRAPRLAALHEPAGARR